jgi:aminopeptidase N
MTTNFFVLQAQRDLNQARNNELQALIDYLKSVVDFETSKVAPLNWPQCDHRVARRRAAAARSSSCSNAQQQRQRPAAPAGPDPG